MKAIKRSSAAESMPAFDADHTIKAVDPELWRAIERENRRQHDHIELIASENYVSPAVLQAQGSQLTNKYAEGYPGRRYYGGCEFVDIVEQLAIDGVKNLFGAEYANVQPHSGSQANQAVYLAVLKRGDAILGMSLAHGGPLTHGAPVNVNGKLFQAFGYGLRPDTEEIDYNAIQRLAQTEDDRRRRVSLLACHRLETIPRDCGFDRRLSLRRHGPLCRFGGSTALRIQLESPISLQVQRTRRFAAPAAASSSRPSSTRRRSIRLCFRHSRVGH